MDCILKTENEPVILGELQDDSASVKDLSYCPEDMTAIYTDRDMMTGTHILQTLLTQSVPHPYCHIPPEDICKRYNDSPSIWIPSELGHPQNKSIDASFTHICIKLLLWVEESRGLDWDPKGCGCYWLQELPWMPVSLGWQGNNVRKASPAPEALPEGYPMWGMADPALDWNCLCDCCDQPFQRLSLAACSHFVPDFLGLNTLTLPQKYTKHWEAFLPTSWLFNFALFVRACPWSCPARLPGKFPHNLFNCLPTRWSQRHMLGSHSCSSMSLASGAKLRGFTVSPEGSKSAW